MKKRNVYLSIGSNIGDKESNLNLAIEQIEESMGRIVKISNFYSNPAEGFIGDDFLNACLHIESNLSPIIKRTFKFSFSIFFSSVLQEKINNTSNNNLLFAFIIKNYKIFRKK